jgi:hypothetical protein
MAFSLMAYPEANTGKHPVEACPFLDHPVRACVNFLNSQVAKNAKGRSFDLRDAARQNLPSLNRCYGLPTTGCPLCQLLGEAFLFGVYPPKRKVFLLGVLPVLAVSIIFEPPSS